MANKSLGIEFKATDNVSGTVQQIERELDSLGDKEKDLQKISERFEKITNSTMWDRKEIYEHFSKLKLPHYNLVTTIDVTRLIAYKQQHKHSKVLQQQALLQLVL